jgi:hypothetical protein
MAMIYAVRELTRDGKPTGKFRMAASSDESAAGIYYYRRCEHKHDTPEEARSCPDVAEELSRIEEFESANILEHLTIDRTRNDPPQGREVHKEGPPSTQCAHCFGAM